MIQQFQINSVNWCFIRTALPCRESHVRQQTPDHQYAIEYERFTVLKLGMWNVCIMSTDVELENIERLDIKILGMYGTRWKGAGMTTTNNYKTVIDERITKEL